MITFEKNVELKRYTTFRIGGSADYFIRVKGLEELTEALNEAHKQKLPFVIIGGGSNILVSDKGYRGLVIIYRGGEFKISGNMLETEGGVFTALLAQKSREQGKGGLEFAANIPGTIGGALVGNAGAYGSSVSDVFSSAEIWSEGEIKTFTKKNIGFGYRDSQLKNKNGMVVISVKINLNPITSVSEADIEEDLKKRHTDYIGANAGSYFKNIDVTSLDTEKVNMLSPFIIHNKVSIGKIIDSLGLKGETVGGAQINPRHGNVFLNVKDATAADILGLEKIAVLRVQEKFGVTLIPEIVKIGF